MTCLGSIPANSKKGLPQHFTSTDDRPVGDYQVLYDEGSSISFHSLIDKTKSGNSMFDQRCGSGRIRTFLVGSGYDKIVRIRPKNVKTRKKSNKLNIFFIDIFLKYNQQTLGRKQNIVNKTKQSEFYQHKFSIGS